MKNLLLFCVIATVTAPSPPPRCTVGSETDEQCTCEVKTGILKGETATCDPFLNRICNDGATRNEDICVRTKVENPELKKYWKRFLVGLSAVGGFSVIIIVIWVYGGRTSKKTSGGKVTKKTEKYQLSNGANGHCIDECDKRRHAFFWCHTSTADKKAWDYCIGNLEAPSKDLGDTCEEDYECFNEICEIDTEFNKKCAVFKAFDLLKGDRPKPSTGEPSAWGLLFYIPLTIGITNLVMELVFPLVFDELPKSSYVLPPA